MQESATSASRVETFAEVGSSMLQILDNEDSRLLTWMTCELLELHKSRFYLVLC